jgi:hypothetical protein
MRNPRVRCAICRHRGSQANKMGIQGRWGEAWLCRECALAICARTAELLSLEEPTRDLFIPTVQKCPSCERDVLTQGYPRRCPVCSKAEPGANQ